MYYKQLTKIIIHENGKTFITLKGKCTVNGSDYKVKLTEQLFNLLEQGVDIMPLIGPEKMEFLISGISPNSWDSLFTPPD